MFSPIESAYSADENIPAMQNKHTANHSVCNAPMLAPIPVIAATTRHKKEIDHRMIFMIILNNYDSPMARQHNFYPAQQR